MIAHEQAELFSSVVLIAPVAHRRMDGGRTFGTAVPIRGRVETGVSRVLNQAGEEVTAMGRVLLDDAYDWVRNDGELTLPDGSTPVIIRVATDHGLNLDTGIVGPVQTVITYGG